MQYPNGDYQEQHSPEELREIQEQIQRIDRLRKLEAKHSSKLINLLSPIQTMKDKKEMEQLRLEIAAFEEMQRRREEIRKRKEARLKRREAIQRGESPLGWILPIILIVFALSLFSMKGIIGGVVFLIAAAFLSPVFKRYLAERQINFNNKFTTLIVIVSLIASAMLTPGIYENENEKDHNGIKRGISETEAGTLSDYKSIASENDTDVQLSTEEPLPSASDISQESRYGEIPEYENKNEYAESTPSKLVVVPETGQKVDELASEIPLHIETTAYIEPEQPDSVSLAESLTSKSTPEIQPTAPPSETQPPTSATETQSLVSPTETQPTLPPETQPITPPETQPATTPETQPTATPETQPTAPVATQPTAPANPGSNVPVIGPPKESVYSGDEKVPVWVPINGGTKYHSRSDCSGMENPIQTLLNTAKEHGYERCKRCW